MLKGPGSKVHGVRLDPVGPRWALCWPHGPCYQGLFLINRPPSRNYCTWYKQNSNDDPSCLITYDFWYNIMDDLHFCLKLVLLSPICPRKSKAWSAPFMPTPWILVPQDCQLTHLNRCYLMSWYWLSILAITNQCISVQESNEWPIDTYMFLEKQSQLLQNLAVMASVFLYRWMLC